MVGVVGDGDVLSEELPAHAVDQAGALVFEGGGGEIVKEEADEIEDGGGFEDYCVAARGEFAGVDRKMGFLAGARCEFLRVEGADVGGVGFGPACGGALLNGDGKLGVRFAISGKEAARISQSGLALAVRVDSGGDLTVLDSQIASATDRAGSLFRGESSGWFDETVYAAIVLLSGHGQETRILRLAAGQGERSFDRRTEGVFVNAVGGGAGGAAIGDGANRNGQTMLGNVLVNGIVGETAQGVGDCVDVDFGLFRSGGFG